MKDSLSDSPHSELCHERGGKDPPADRNENCTCTAQKESIENKRGIAKQKGDGGGDRRILWNLMAQKRRTQHLNVTKQNDEKTLESILCFLIHMRICILNPCA